MAKNKKHWINHFLMMGWFIFMMIFLSCNGGSKLEGMEDFLNENEREMNEREMSEEEIKKLSLELELEELSNRGWGLQHIAADKGFLKILKKLAEKRFNMREKDRWGWTLAHIASRKGKKKVVEWLIKNQGLEIGEKTKGGETLLHIATLGGNKELVDWLIQKNIDVHATTNYGLTATDVADYHNYWGIYWFLKGFEGFERDIYGWLSLWDALNVQSLELLKFIAHRVGLERIFHRNVFNRKTLHHKAARLGFLEGMKWLLDQGLKVNGRDIVGETVLHEAALGRNLEVMEWLVNENGLEVDAKTDYGLNVLHYAVNSRDQRVVSWVLSQGLEASEVNCQDKYGLTAIHYAIRNGDLEILDLLIQNKGRLGIKNKAGLDEKELSKVYGRKKIQEFLKK